MSEESIESKSDIEPVEKQLDDINTEPMTNEEIDMVVNAIKGKPQQGYTDDKPKMPDYSACCDATKRTLIWIAGVLDQINESIIAQEILIEPETEMQELIKDSAILFIADFVNDRGKQVYANEGSRRSALNEHLSNNKLYRASKKKTDQARNEIKRLNAQKSHFERLFKIEQMSFQHQINASLIPGIIQV